MIHKYHFIKSLKGSTIELFLNSDNQDLLDVIKDWSLQWRASTGYRCVMCGSDIELVKVLPDRKRGAYMSKSEENHYLSSISFSAVPLKSFNKLQTASLCYVVISLII